MPLKIINLAKPLLFIALGLFVFNSYSQETYIGYDLPDSQLIPLSEKNIFKNGTVYVIPSSHQDIAWENTPEWCIRFRDEHVISPALQMLKANPAYHYSVESALSFYEYMDRHPEKKEEISKYIREGRLEWGATFNQPYEGLYTGEALIRQLYLGKRYLEKEIPGGRFEVAWNPDPPSRVMQMPQILAKSGVKSLLFSRYEPGVYKWQSPDGSAITAFSAGQYFHSDWLLNDISKGNHNNRIVSTKELGINLHKTLSHAQPHYLKGNLKPQLAVVSSKDLAVPTDFSELMNDWNRGAKQMNMPNIKYSTFAKFTDAVIGAGSSPEILKGDWPNTWLYIHGPTHHKTVADGREAHKMLPDAEKLSLICQQLSPGDEYPAKEFERAWFNAIYPDHGWGGNNGAVTDSVFGAKFSEAKKAAEAIIQNSLSKLYSKVQFDTLGIPLLIFNPSGFKRTSAVTCDIDFHGFADKVNNKTMRFQLVGNDDKAVPYQVVPGSGHEEGLRITFIANNVPATGYKTFYLKEVNNLVRENLPAKTENNFYRISFLNGGVKEIFDKQLGADILNTDKFLGGEFFTMHSAGNGAGEFTNVQQPDMEGYEASSGSGASWNCVEKGPVKTSWETFSLMGHNNLKIRVSLYHLIKRIDFEYDILAFDGTKEREFRCAFPLAIQDAEIKYHTPMAISTVGVTELKGMAGRAHSKLLYDEELKNIHPREVLNWFAAVNKDQTVLISSDVSAFDWMDPTDNPVGYPVLQPVLLASRVSCNGKGNWYLQPGDHHFRFSLTSGKTSQTDLMKTDIENNQEFYSYANIHHRSSEKALLPEELGFFEFNEPGVLVSTIKKAEDDGSTVIRLFDYSGNKHKITLKSYFNYKQLFSTNMLEKEGIKIDKNKITIDPFSIETFLLK